MCFICCMKTVDTKLSFLTAAQQDKCRENYICDYTGHQTTQWLGAERTQSVCVQSIYQGLCCRLMESADCSVCADLYRWKRNNGAIKCMVTQQACLE